MVDWSSSPGTQDGHSTELAATRQRDEANARMDYSGETNIPVGTIRFANSRWETWDGSAWNPSASTYAITVANADQAANAASAANADNANQLNGQAPSHYLSRGNHTGTQPLSTITGVGTAAPLDFGNGADQLPKSKQLRDGTYLSNTDETVFSVRRIRAGTSAPADSVGNNGDLFLVYE